jgi:hypothetical protein
MSFFLRKLSNLPGEAGVTVGTTPDGGVPAGIGAVIACGADWAGVVRSGGTVGAGQAGRAGRESSARDHSRVLPGSDGGTHPEASPSLRDGDQARFSEQASAGMRECAAKNPAPAHRQSPEPPH